jgi:hypothetical protein
VDNINKDLVEIGWGDVGWIYLVQDRETWRVLCERGNEISGSIKCQETIEWLHNWWALDYCSAP